MPHTHNLSHPALLCSASYCGFGQTACPETSDRHLVQAPEDDVSAGQNGNKGGPVRSLALQLRSTSWLSANNSGDFVTPWVCGRSMI